MQLKWPSAVSTRTSSLRFDTLRREQTMAMIHHIPEPIRQPPNRLTRFCAAWTSLLWRTNPSLRENVWWHSPHTALWRGYPLSLAHFLWLLQTCRSFSLWSFALAQVQSSLGHWRWVKVWYLRDGKQNVVKAGKNRNLLHVISIGSTIFAVFPGAARASSGCCYEWRKFCGFQRTLAWASPWSIAFIKLGWYLFRLANVKCPCVGWWQHANISNTLDGRGGV